MTLGDAPSPTLPADVVPIAVPAPYVLVPEVNAYLILGAEPTLIDGGPSYAPAAAAVERALDEAGLRPTDLRRILLTHHHADHAGLAHWARERSAGRAPLTAIEPVAGALADIDRWIDADAAFAEQLMLLHGFDEAETAAMLAVEASHRPYHHVATVDEILAPGDEVQAGDRTFAVHLRPGHSPFDTLFHDERDGLLVAGDHLLATLPSTPYLHAPQDAPDPAAAAADAPSPLPDYLASLRTTADLDARLVLPGHGPPFARPGQLIARRLRGYDRRARQLLDRLREPVTARALMEPGLPVERRYVVFSDLLGLLDLLTRQGLARRLRTPSSISFVVTAASAAVSAPR